MKDKLMFFSDDQTIAIAASTVLSDYSIDTTGGAAAGTTFNGGTVPWDIGKGGDIGITCQITETVTSGGSSTTLVDVVMADDAALTSNLTVLNSTQAIGKATLVAGYKFRIGCNVPVGVSKRYLGLRYTVGTATQTAGKISAWLGPASDWLSA